MGKLTREERRRTFEMQSRFSVPRQRRARTARGDERGVSARAWVLVFLLVAVLLSAVVVQATSAVSLRASASTLIDRLLPPVR